MTVSYSRYLLPILLFLLSRGAAAQTLGGASAYNFLKLPASPLLTAAGGVNVSWRSAEAGLALNNPSQLDPSLHGQLALSFNPFLAGIKSYTLAGVAQHRRSQTTLGGQVHFFDYGTIDQTDAAGNVSGSFRAVDFAVQFSASRSYLERWRYGLSLKLIRSSYGLYRSSALALDAGLSYTDTALGFSASVLARNMGTQLSTYAGQQEDLPFDLQLGITQRLKKAPLGFSLTAQQLHRFNLQYGDTAFNNANGWENRDGFANKLFHHFVMAAHLYLGKNLEATVGYNHLRRSELNLGSAGNGLNGFSMGLRARFNQLELQYGRSHYQRNIAYNQVGLVLKLTREL